MILTAPRGTGTRLRVVSPEEDFALPYSSAKVLRALRIGDHCEIHENLSDREVLTVWHNAIVVSPPDVPRLAGGADDGEEYHTIANLEFFHVQEDA